MSKTIKITKSQINNLINEEVARFKKIKSLENRKNEILSKLNEMYEIEELNELGIDEANIFQKIGLQKDPAAEKAAFDAMSQKFDTEAQAYLANPKIQANPNLVKQYQQSIANQKAQVIPKAVANSKAWGAKGGHFNFVPGGPGKLIIQYEQGNVIPAMGGSFQPGGSGTAE